jgi:type IV secretory pathway VirB10-like protein
MDVMFRLMEKGTKIMGNYMTRNQTTKINIDLIIM